MAEQPGPAIEDYVKVIHGHTEWQPAPITPSRLAARLGLAPSSVTEMVKKLAVQGLVDHQPYGAISLTAAGTALALRMVRRHRLIETWLVEVLGYTWDEVHDEAEVLEHAVSDRLLDALDAQLGHPVRDPHGDPIPSANGDPRRVDAVRLSEASGGRVVRVSDENPDDLRELARRGIHLDAVIEADAVPAALRGAVWVAPVAVVSAPAADPVAAPVTATAPTT